MQWFKHVYICPGWEVQLLGPSSLHQMDAGLTLGRGKFGEQLIEVSLSLSKVNLKNITG